MSGQKRMRVAILGCRGIPNQYGGFEQFAEKLAPALVSRHNMDVWVYNSGRHPLKDPVWKGVHRILCHDPEHRIGQAGQFVYDWLCIRDSRRRDFDVILQLGYTSNSIWHWRLPKGAAIITNMDGLEWQRQKYSPLVRRFLRHAEALAAKHSHVLVADSLPIQRHLEEAYGRQAEYIPYGAVVLNEDAEFAAGGGPGTKMEEKSQTAGVLNPDNRSEPQTPEKPSQEKNAEGNDPITASAAEENTGDNDLNPSLVAKDRVGNNDLAPASAVKKTAGDLNSTPSAAAQENVEDNDLTPASEAKGNAGDPGPLSGSEAKETMAEYNLVPGGYYLLIARLQADNHILEILRGHSASLSDCPLVLVGDTNNRFGRRLKKAFGNGKVLFTDAIFDQEKLRHLRRHCRIYFHGHSSGGTNPSLLEAMADSALICAHDNPFNRAVLGDDALYFTREREISYRILKGLSSERRRQFIQNNLKKLTTQYRWPEVIDAYAALIRKACGVC